MFLVLLAGLYIAAGALDLWVTTRRAKLYGGLQVVEQSKPLLALARVFGDTKGLVLGVMVPRAGLALLCVLLHWWLGFAFLTGAYVGWALATLISLDRELRLILKPKV